MDYICSECKHEQDSMMRKCDKCKSVRVVLKELYNQLMQFAEEQLDEDEPKGRFLRKKV